MLPTHRRATHPGVVLTEDFLVPMGLTAEAIGIDPAVAAGTKPVTEAVARQLSQRFGTVPAFWLHLQAAYDRTGP